MGDAITALAFQEEQLRSCTAGTTLIHQGQRLDNPHTLMSGWAALGQNAADGRPQIIALYLPGDMIGLGHVPGETAICAVTAVTKVVLAPAMVPEGERLALLAPQKAHLVRQAMRTAHKSAKERTADFLLETYHRLSAAGLAERHAFALPLTQSVFAATLGMSTVHMNRTLMQLQREKLISRQGERIILEDRDGLSRLADFRPL